MNARQKCKKLNKKIEDSFETSITMSEHFREWLSTFNTNSATACFTAVQNLKNKIDFKEKL